MIELVTGTAGKDHVTSADIGAYNAGTVGEGAYILPIGNRMQCEKVNDNTVRIRDGILLYKGRQIIIEPGDYEEVNINNGASGTRRHDLVVVRVEKNADTSVESATAAVITGEFADTPVDPAHTSGTILEGDYTIDECPICRVVKNGLAIESVEMLVDVITNMADLKKEITKKAEQTDLEALEKRMNAFETLPEGSTAGNKELLDIRNGVDGTVYSSAGEAVRKQIKKLQKGVENAELADKAIRDSAGNIIADTYQTKTLELNTDVLGEWLLGGIAGDDSLKGIAYGNGRFVLVDNSANIYYSDSGVAWTYASGGMKSILYDVTYGDGKFVAVGNNCSKYSEDGINWHDGGSFGGISMFSVTYGDGKFVAVGGEGDAYYSTDSVEWVKGSTGRSANLNSVIYANGKFVAVGGEGGVCYSEDGINWPDGEKCVTNTLYSIAYGSGRFVAVGDGAKCYSEDGITWVSGMDTGDTALLYGIAYGNGKFVAVGDSGVTYYSSDGETWTTDETIASTTLQGITYANGIFIAVGFSGATYYTEFEKETKYIEDIIPPMYEYLMYDADIPELNPDIHIIPEERTLWNKTAEAAEKIGDTEGTVVWENASPNSVIDNGISVTLDVDIADYKYWEIFYNDVGTIYPRRTGKIPINASGAGLMSAVYLTFIDRTSTNGSTFTMAAYKRNLQLESTRTLRINTLCDYAVTTINYTVTGKISLIPTKIVFYK